MDRMSDPLAAARALLLEDPDPETRAELEALVGRAEAGDEAARRDLADRMSGPLEFGTAGLRGRVEAGLSRMNRLAVPATPRSGIRARPVRPAFRPSASADVASTRNPTTRNPASRAGPT